jgi:uncharacterized protein (DUF433 family)
MAKVRPLAKDDPRIIVPLYTFSEVAQYIRLPATTVRNWARGYDYPTTRGPGHSESLVRVLPVSGRQPRVPFMGLAAAVVIAGFRQKKIRMEKIRAALREIERSVGVDYALANEQVYTAGAEILLAYAKKNRDDEIRDLIDPTSGQTSFVKPIRQYLELISYGADEWAERIYLPGFKSKVVVDMHRGFGQPILEKHRLRVVDIADRFWYGEDDPADIAADLEIDESEVLDVIHATGRTAAA